MKTYAFLTLTAVILLLPAVVSANGNKNDFEEKYRWNKDKKEFRIFLLGSFRIAEGDQKKLQEIMNSNKYSKKAKVPKGKTTFLLREDHWALTKEERMYLEDMRRKFSSDPIMFTLIWETLVDYDERLWFGTGIRLSHEAKKKHLTLDRINKFGEWLVPNRGNWAYESPILLSLFLLF